MMTKSEMMSIAKNQKSFPQNLFKYRADNEFTKNIVRDNELWFANPHEFNDPYDCNTPITNSADKSEIEEWAKSIGIFEKNMSSFVEEFLKNPNILKDSTEKAMKNSGVCCFSTLNDSILQWAHYSDFHKGICLRFDIYEDPELFWIPIIVSYRSALQHYNHFIHQDKLIEYLMQPKYSGWSYESEVRIVKTEIEMKRHKDNRAFKFKDFALKEIIFGVKSTDETINLYKNLCASNNKKHVKFSKMQLGTGANYELIKKGI